MLGVFGAAITIDPSNLNFTFTVLLRVFNLSRTCTTAVSYTGSVAVTSGTGVLLTRIAVRSFLSTDLEPLGCDVSIGWDD